MEQKPLKHPTWEGWYHWLNLINSSFLLLLCLDRRLPVAFSWKGLLLGRTHKDRSLSNLLGSNTSKRWNLNSNPAARGQSCGSSPPHWATSQRGKQKTIEHTRKMSELHACPQNCIRGTTIGHRMPLTFNFFTTPFTFIFEQVRDYFQTLPVCEETWPSISFSQDNHSPNQRQNTESLLYATCFTKE